ncbi:hypothetical protein Tco_0317187 [Tanacetum coccineum]
MSRDDKSVSHEVQLNYAFLNLLSYKMVSYVNVLGPGVLDIIAAESNGTAIVTIQGNLIEDKAVVSVATASALRNIRALKISALSYQLHRVRFRLSTNGVMLRVLSLSPNTKGRSVRPAYENKRRWRVWKVRSSILVGFLLVSTSNGMILGLLSSLSTLVLMSLIKGHCFPKVEIILPVWFSIDAQHWEALSLAFHTLFYLA